MRRRRDGSLAHRFKLRANIADGYAGLGEPDRADALHCPVIRRAAPAPLEDGWERDALANAKPRGAAQGLALLWRCRAHRQQRRHPRRRTGGELCSVRGVSRLGQLGDRRPCGFCDRVGRSAHANAAPSPRGCRSSSARGWARVKAARRPQAPVAITCLAALTCQSDRAASESARSAVATTRRFRANG